MQSLLRSAGEEALDWLYPRKCALCGRLAKLSPCRTCASEMTPATPSFLSELAESPLAFRACVYSYSGRAAHAVRKLKYSRSTSLIEYMAALVARRVEEVAEPDSLVVPVPLHPSRRALRGFNQAELCAKFIRDMQVRPDLLRRVRSTRPQAGLSLKEREHNLNGAFEAGAEVQGKQVVLIDDVVTSGHTARECARALKSQGASSVGIVAFCGNLE